MIAKRDASEARTTGTTAMNDVPFDVIEPPVANPLPRPPGRIRCSVEDFVVDEELSFEPTDDGEHVLIHVRKVNLTTQDVQKWLANCCGVSRQHIGYAGLKDKRSVATQWFSVYKPQVIDLAQNRDIEILAQRRHVRKLRRTDVLCNRFKIVVRDIDPGRFATERIRAVPNYFGSQRFGRDGQNVIAALKWVDCGKPRISTFLRSMYLSSMRSHVFNRVLAGRVYRGNWCELVDGDVVVDGKPTGPLWGRGRPAATGCALQIEEFALNTDATIMSALEWVGLQQERRAFVANPLDMACDVSGSSVVLRFALPAGCFATSVLREYFDYRSVRN